MKRVAIVQSNYIPWKGYFDMIAAVDEFILYDDMQFTKNDWRNRNKLKTPKGLEWISIPVGSSINRKIKEVNLPDNAWRVKHLKTFELNYGRARYYEEVMSILNPIYHDSSILTLSAFNKTLINAVCIYLGIDTKISYSWDYELKGRKVERLVNLCKQVGACIYVSGPAAKDYLLLDLFKQENISIEWFDYSDYPDYPQLWGQFEHGVSVLDLIFNNGQDSKKFMKLSKR